MKKVVLMIVFLTIILACSIDKMEEILVNTFSIEKVDAGTNTEHPWGGYWVYFLVNDAVTDQIFLSNGADGKDGIDGVNGIDGIDGKDGADGVSVTMYKQEVEGGTILTIIQGDDVFEIFIQDGLDGLDGIDGLDGQDGVSVKILTEEIDGGTVLTIIQGDEITKVFVYDGKDGKDGKDGVNGLDGTSVIITTEEIEGGTVLTITQGTEIIKVFVEDGKQGEQGEQGIQGIQGIRGLAGADGKDGKDGADVTMTQTEVTGGTYLYFYVNEVLISEIFVEDGAQGDEGIPGTPGDDGVSTTIKVEDGDDGEDGYYIVFLENNVEITRIFVNNGEDGKSVTVTTEDFDGGYYLYVTDYTGTYTITILDGDKGDKGEDGEDYTNGDGTVTICHKVTHPVAAHPEWVSNTNVTLTLSLSEYIEHIYEFHNGNSSQNDSFGSCE